MNWTKQLLAQPQFEILSVPWDEKIQHSVADWRVNWLKHCTSEMKCYSTQDQDGLKLDISAGKCKFWILKTSFFFLVPLRITLLSSAHWWIAISLCPLYLFTTRAFALLQGYPEASWFLPMSWYCDAASKCWSLEASWNTAERPVAGWIKHCKFPKFCCLGQTPCLFFRYSPSRLALKDPVLCQASTYEKQRYCMSWQIWRYF